MINKIAAGEVVDRPASVIKELVENSIDAGANRIEIIVEKSGGHLIRIVDNGCGIDEEQIEIAFSRHATSKISSFDDLDRLDSYGFRGEALPSIASVSRLRMLSRTHTASAGREIIIEGGVLQSNRPAAASVGTTIEVENLFYNTPARRKFLKSESTESRHISRIATALALSRFDIAFSYSLNERKQFTVGASDSLQPRVAELLGGGEKFVGVDGSGGPAIVAGHIGIPDMARNNRYGLYLFINGRFITSAVLSHAVQAGYKELLPKGRYPVGVLHLTVDPAEVDVNVHPTKIEVRLSHEREIHDCVYRAVKESLMQDGLIPSFRPTSGSTVVQPTVSAPTGRQAVIPGLGQSRPVDLRLYHELYRNDSSKAQSSHTASAGETEIIQVDRSTGEIVSNDHKRERLSESQAGPQQGFRFIGRFADLYLVLQSGEDMFIVDQHTAHERVLYEQLLGMIEREAVNSQQLLFPEQVELSPEQMTVFEEHSVLLDKSGFVVSPFGGRTVNIEAVPAILSGKSPQRLLVKILDDLSSLTKSGLDIRKSLAQSMACRAAVMAGDRLGDSEATHLLKSLLECENSYSCPHGRPTFMKITRRDLDKQFGRG